MSTDPIHVNYSSVYDLGLQVLNLGIALDNAGKTPVGTFTSDLTTGAGEFASHVGDPLAQMTKTWQLWATTVSDDCSIVGNAAWDKSLDFHRIDAMSWQQTDIEL